MFAAGAAASAISAEDLAQSMKLVGPVANLAGQSLQATTTEIALLGNAGLKATEAGTGLRGVLASLESPGKKAQAALDALGITAKDSAGNLLPLDQIMTQLKDSGANASDMFKIFGRESSAAAAVLMNNAGPAWAAMTTEIQNSEGAAKKMSDTLNTGVNGALEQLKGSVETAGIALGTTLEPVVLTLVNAGTSLVNDFLLPAIQWFGDLPAPVQGFILTIVALAAALGPVLLAVGGLATAIATLGPVLAPIAAVLGGSALAFGGWVIAIAAAIAALVALGVWVYQNWDAIMAVIDAGLANIVGKLKDFVDWMAKIVPSGSAAGIALANVAQELSAYSDKLAFNAQKHKLAKDAADDTAAAHKAAGEAAKKSGDEHAGLTGKLGDTKDEHIKLRHATDDTAAAHKASKEEAKKAKDEHKALAAALAEAGKEAKACAAEFHALNEKNEILYAIAQKLSGAKTKLAQDIAAATLSGHNMTQEFGDGLAPAIGKVDAATGLLQTKFDAMTGSNGLPLVLAKLGEVKLAIDPAVGSIASMNQGLAALGITSAATFTQLAADAQTAYDKVIAAPDATTWERDSAFLKLLAAEKAAMLANGEEIPALMEKQMTDLKAKVEGKTPEVKGAFDGLASSVSTVITNFAQDISKSLWEGDTSWGEKGKKLLTSLGEAVTSSFIEPAAKAISKFITTEIADLLGEKGLGGIWTALKSIGSAVAGVFSGAASAGGTMGGESIARAAAGPAGAASSGGGSVASSVGGAVSGAIPLVGAIGSVGTMVSSIIGNFQNAQMEKTLNAIEESTRYLKIGLVTQPDSLLNDSHEMRNQGSDFAKWVQNVLQTYLFQINVDLDDISGKLSTASTTLADMLGDARERAPAAQSFMDFVSKTLDGMSGKLDMVIAGSQMTMNLFGTDPTAVAAKIATQMRLQGATA